MDIFSFVNSKDTREYLKSIDYHFSQTEQAWLIFKCKNKTFEEKRTAWRELMAMMPDCSVPPRGWYKGTESLYNVINQYINETERIINSIGHNPEGKYVYSYSILYDDSDEISAYFDDVVYSSYQKCEAGLIAEVNECGEGLSNVEKYRILRKIIDANSFKDAYDLILEYSSEMKVTRVFYSNDKCFNELEDFWGHFWFDFPTPFKKGDIVWIPEKENRIRWNMDGGFVIEKMSTWETLPYIHENGDNSDMNGSGFFANDDGTVYREILIDYMDWEYYKGPYKKNEMKLMEISELIKKEKGYK